MAWQCEEMVGQGATSDVHNASVHNGRLIPGVLLSTEPYHFADLAEKIRDALDGFGLAAALVPKPTAAVSHSALMRTLVRAPSP